MITRKITTLKLPILAGASCVLLASCHVSEAAPPSDATIAAITAAAPSRAARTAKARKILAYTRANGFRHSSIETGAQALTILGRKTGAWSTVVSDDPGAFEDLTPYDAVVFMSTTGDALLPANFNTLDEAAKTSARANESRYKTNLLSFVKGGKGFAGIHSATDTMYSSPEYGEMIGGYFDGHPWNAGDEVTIRVEDNNPITERLKGQSLSFKEEIYQFRDPFNRSKQRVLMGIDLGKTAPKNGMKRADNDYPVTWIKTHGAGRVFYTSLGHNEKLYSDSQVLGIYLAGIQYAIGDLKADTSPLAQLPTPVNDPVLGEYALPARKIAVGAMPTTLVRIFPEGESKYRAVALDLYPRISREVPQRVELVGTLQNNFIAFSGMDGDTEIKATWNNGNLALARGTEKSVTLRKFIRTSPTLAQKPPQNALVLLPYSHNLASQTQGPSLEAWTNQNWTRLRDGSLQVRGGDNRTQREFGDIQLHLEWLTPLKPEARGQERGNSGVYLQDRYEVQILDSFGLDAQDNDAGGIYKTAKPLLNASLPPGQWQTYDITFRAPRFYTDGAVARPATITVLHNGVLIQKDVPISGSTASGNPSPAVAKGPIRLQDHGNPVRFRNIWVQELNDQPWKPVSNPLKPAN